MRISVLLLAFVLFGSVPSARAQNEQSLRDAFLAEAVETWRKLPTDFPCFRIETKKTVRRTESGSKDSVHTYRYVNQKSTSGSELGSVEEEYGQALATKTVCINDRYAFLATKRQAGNSWLLDRIDLHPSQGPDVEVGGYKIRGSKNTFYGWLTINPNLQLIDLVTNPTFKIITASERPNREVRIEFTATNLVKKVIEEKYTGWLQFDRSRYWALTSYEISVTDSRDRDPGVSAETKCTHQFVNHPKNLPVRFKMQEENKGYLAPNKLFMTVTTEIETKYTDDCPKESEFELSAFGISEPVGVAPKRNTLIWWFIGGGIFVALLGYFVIKRSRKV